MYTVLLALLFGILEGITEWLPISSTGHLILLRHFLPVTYQDAFFELFEVVIQLGALLAVTVLFFDTLWPFSRKKSRAKRRDTWRLWGKIALAALPAAAMGLLLDDLIDTLLFHPLTVALALIGYGILFCLPKRREQTPRCNEITDLTTRDALVIGCFQILALVPGTSRSGATILGGLAIGISRPVSALFSFFLGIPTMVGAGALKAIKFFASGEVLSAAEWMTLGVATLAAFLVSLATLRFLTDFVRRHTFAVFGIYRIVLGILVLLVFIFT
ncbi:MAG: undecaprenyl-diphosphate phosphatase [Clostridia bacterium]|nr:undecaprenyl-diphosphate phosphatase [Clostridia bacterium]